VDKILIWRDLPKLIPAPRSILTSGAWGFRTDPKGAVPGAKAWVIQPARARDRAKKNKKGEGNDRDIQCGPWPLRNISRRIDIAGTPDRNVGRFHFRRSPLARLMHWRQAGAACSSRIYSFSEHGFLPRGRGMLRYASRRIAPAAHV